MPSIERKEPPDLRHNSGNPIDIPIQDGTSERIAQTMQPQDSDTPAGADYTRRSFLSGDDIVLQQSLSETLAPLMLGNSTNPGVNRRCSRSRSRVLEHLESDMRGLEEIERKVTLKRSVSRKSGSTLNPIKEKEEDNLSADDTPLQHKKWMPPSQPLTKTAAFFKSLHESYWIIRYLVYVVPIAVILIVPIIVFATTSYNSFSSGLRRMWLAVWIELVWLSFWASRVIAKLIPAIVGVLISILTNDFLKYQYMLKNLEIHMTLSLWLLANNITFRSICLAHNFQAGQLVQWQKETWKVMIALFVGSLLNLAEKTIIQIIAMNFHHRQYADRIAESKFAIEQFAKMYSFTKTHAPKFTTILNEDIREKLDHRFGNADHHRDHGYFKKALYQTEKVLLTGAANVRKGARATHQMIGKIADDLNDRKIKNIANSKEIVSELLSTNNGAQILARQIFKAFAQPDSDSIVIDDFREVYAEDFSDSGEEELFATFSLLDKDSNGDISMEELETRLMEIGKNKKTISKSVKDLDLAVRKLDSVMSCLVLVIFLLILLCLIFSNFSGILTSAGTVILGLSWVLSSTAQEFLGSCIFVLSKHPFDVGDRVDIMFNGMVQSLMVREINLLCTEFLLLDGKVIQAPNSLLNTLFILNHRRSAPNWETVMVNVKFGTSLEQIESLRQAMLAYVKTETRDFKPEISTELFDITNLMSVRLKVSFCHKANWQNEKGRMLRRNKFMCALMTSIQSLGLEPSLELNAGKNIENPLYSYTIPVPPSYNSSINGTSGLSAPSKQGDNSSETYKLEKSVDFSLGATAASDPTLQTDFDVPEKKTIIKEIIREKSGTVSQKKEARRLREQQSAECNQDSESIELSSVLSRENRFSADPGRLLGDFNDAKISEPKGKMMTDLEKQ